MLPIRNKLTGGGTWCRALAGIWALALLLLIAGKVAAAEPTPLRIGLTPIIAYDQVALVEDFRKYVEGRLGRPVEVLRRDSYRQVIDLLAQDQIDCAWVSVYPYVYVQHNYNLRLLATPVYRGKPFFRGYLIVPADDTGTTSLLQLQGRIFAYADPYSFTGYLLPRFELHQAGKDAATFFAKTFFTKGHKRVVQAVAAGLADGGFVDSYIWDTLALTEPRLTAKTRVIEMSALHGFPPLVAAHKLKDREFAQVRRVLLDMAADPEGLQLLKRMSLDGFVAGDPKWYEEAARMMRVVGDI